MKFVLSIIFLGGLAFAEPIVLEQAQNVEKEMQLETGADFNYYWIKFSVEGSGIESTYTHMPVPLLLKFGITPDAEARILAPYTLRTLKKESATGSSDTNYNGIGQMLFGFKYNFLKEGEGFPAFSMSVNLDLPTADAKKTLGEGFNVGAMGIFTQHLSPIAFHLNAGYQLTGEFTNANDAKINTGDNIIYGAGVDWPLDGLVKGLTFLTEVWGTNFGNMKVDGVDQSNTKGNTLAVIPGLRFDESEWKIKAAFAYNILNDSPPDYVPTIDYKWRIIFGISYLFNF